MIDPPIMRKKKLTRKRPKNVPSPKIIRGLIQFSGNSRWSREETVIRRINSFLPSNSLLNYRPNNLLANGWSTYRKMALKAINYYIKSFPFLSHTPASLRAAFGMPTRKDRQRGKFSGVSLIAAALGWDNPSHNNRDTIPDLPPGDMDTVKSLKTKLLSKKHENDLSRELVEYLDQQLLKNPLKEIIIPEINTHSDESLIKVKNYLERFNISKLDYDIHQEEDHPLTPDLIGFYQDRLVWAELKEWDPNSKNLFLKPIKQIFQYLHEAPIVVVICSPRLEFIKFLESKLEWKISDLQLELALYQGKSLKEKESIDFLRKKFIKIGEIMFKKYNLSPREEALLASLISAKTHEDLGVISTEVDAGSAIETLIEHYSLKWDKLSVFNFSVLSNGIPKLNHPILLIGSLEEEKV